MSLSTLAGLSAALRLTVRRNWLFWLVWAVGLSLMMPATLSQYATVIPPGTDPRQVVEPLRLNPTLLALLGPAFDLYDKGGFVFWRAGGLPAAGATAAGLALTANGAFFVALGAVLAQVFDNARGTRAWTAGAGLGGMFLARALVDGSGEGSAVEPLRWAIPLEWPLLARPFAEERWWAFLLSFGAAAVLVGLAFVLKSAIPGPQHGRRITAARGGSLIAADHAQ